MMASSSSSPPTRIDCETTIGRLRHGQPGADRSRHRLLDQVGLAGAGRVCGLLDGALLDPGHAGRHAHDHPRMRPAVLVHLLDEMAEHLLGHIEIGDHAVLERADGLDVAGRPAEHALGLDTDGVHVAGALVDCNHRWLRQHDAAAPDVYQRVGGAQIHSHIAAAESGQ
jgi:hypothetical protein